MSIDYKKYGKVFRIISRVLRGYGYCAFCGAQNRYPNPRTGSRVVLTVHHINLDGPEGDHHINNLVPLCQQCHLAMHHNRPMGWVKSAAMIHYQKELPILIKMIKDIGLIKATKGKISMKEREKLNRCVRIWAPPRWQSRLKQHNYRDAEV